ncbi:MAG: SpoIIE family protein phosphatase [Bryobacteraceae bacterium]
MKSLPRVGNLAKRTKDNRLHYAVLALLFTLTATYHVHFFRDLWKDFTFRYTAPPFWLSSPWPTLTAFIHDTAEPSGLRTGDRILSVDGRRMDGLSDLLGPVRRKNPGDSIQVVAERAGRAQTHVVVLRSVRTKQISGLVYTFAAVMFVLMPTVSILLGFGVAGVRPRDPMAWLLLFLMISMAQFSVGNVNIMGWPAWIRFPSHVYRSLANVWPACLMLFGIYFNERWPVDRRWPWIKWVLLAPLIGLPCLHAVLNVGMSEAFRAVEPIAGLGPKAQEVYRLVAMAGVALFFFSIGGKSRYAKIGPDARRRLRLLLWGAMVSMTPLLILVLYSARFGFEDNLWSALAIMMTVLFPVTMAYVIVVQKAMDVRVAIRQGVQYTFARRGLLVLQVAVSALVILWVAIYAGYPGVETPQRVLAAAAAVASIFLVGSFASKVGGWVDRRFFREAYNADAILSELSDNVRTMVETKTLLQTVADRLASTLHVPSVAMMVSNNGRFEPAYVVGCDDIAGIRFADRAGTVARLERARKPVRLYLEDERSWVYRPDVSDDERLYLGKLDSQLLLPLTARQKMLGFISLGRKQSDEPFSPTDVRLLRSVASQTGLALENSRLAAAVAQEIAQRELFNRELEIAREVQQRLFPQSFPEVQGLEYSGTCRPAQGVGGDYFDFLDLPQGRFGVAIGDVSGKGIPAALLMASLQASLRGQTIRRVHNLADLIGSVNRLIFDASPPNRYATFFYAQYSPATRLLQYVNAGHNAPILLRCEEAIRLDIGGPVVGLFRQAAYQEGRVELQPNDLLILFTDGISEAMNPAEEEWGEEELEKSARQYCTRPVNEIMKCLISGADGFAGGAPQHDDMTIVVLKVTSPSATAP